MDEVWALLTKASAGGPAVNFVVLIAMAYGLFKVVIPQIATWRSQASEERNGDFARLRADIARQDAKIDKLESELSEERERHETELRMERHRLNNMTQCFDALVLLLETNPERVPEALARVKEMRANQALAEAQEKGAAFAGRKERAAQKRGAAAEAADDEEAA